jgi:GAF domain-containing protein
MVTVTRALAERMADVARLLSSEESSDEALRRLTDLGVELIPGVTAAAVIAAGERGFGTFAASDPRIEDLHRQQFESGDGPVVEALRHNEPRRINDTRGEQRWPGFCKAAARAGFGSCLVLPLRGDWAPAIAVALYGQDERAFQGSAHDIALLFAAQGATAVHNATLYRACRRMVDGLHTALESRAAIEQAKGILHADLGISPEAAFELLSRRSQDTNKKVRDIAADLVRGRIDSSEFRPQDPSAPRATR